MNKTNFQISAKPNQLHNNDFKKQKEITYSDQKRQKKFLKEISKTNNSSLTQNMQDEQLIQDFRRLNINDRQTNSPLYRVDDINSPDRNRNNLPNTTPQKEFQIESSVRKSVKQNQNDEDYSLLEYNYE